MNSLFFSGDLMMTRLFFLNALAWLTLFTAAGADIPWLTHGDDYSAAIDYGITQARATLPQTQGRFGGELRGQADFYCAVRLADARGHIEQVFVKVKDWQERVTGTISTSVAYVWGYQKGQEITFDSTDILDWVIRFPDGHEEGNFIGRALADLPR
jgi:hypothetical protein